MPWPNRLPSGSSLPSIRLSTPVTENRQNQYTQTLTASQYGESADIHGVPLLQTTPLPRPAAGIQQRRQGSHHGRSFSNPFPSLFGGKKANKGHGFDIVDTGAETLDDLSFGDTQNNVSAKELQSGLGESTPREKSDFTTGKCMTCGSTVKWAGHLEIFRCTICLTINDLKPPFQRNPPPNDCSFASQVGLGIKSMDGVGKKVASLSLERTRTLADECLSAYLCTRLICFGRIRNGNDLQVHDVDNHVPGGCSHVEGHNKPNVAATTLSNNPGLKPKFRRYSMDHVSQDLEGDTSCRMPLLKPVADNQKNLSDQLLTQSGIVMAPPKRAPPPPPHQASARLVRHNLLGQDRVGVHATGMAQPKSVFQSLEEYILDCFKNCDNVNASFAPSRPMPLSRAFSEGAPIKVNVSINAIDQFQHDSSFADLDAKTLLAGNIAENGLWWTGRGRIHSLQAPKSGYDTLEDGDHRNDRIRGKVPCMRWLDIHQWYETILRAGSSWEDKIRYLRTKDPGDQYHTRSLSAEDMNRIDNEITEARLHLRKTLLRASESLLKRPGRPLKYPEDCRFLLILLANPLLYPVDLTQQDWIPPENTNRARSQTNITDSGIAPGSHQPASLGSHGRSQGPASRRHSGVLKRILGLLSNCPKGCHHYVIMWFTQLPEKNFQGLVEMVESFVTYRLARYQGRQHGDSHHQRASDLIPQIPRCAPGTSAHLHAAIGGGMASKSPTLGHGDITEYYEDWQIRAAARVMALLFTANDNVSSLGHDRARGNMPVMRMSAAFPTASQRAHRRGQFLPISMFYNSMVDYSDLIADFEVWESRREKFSFCQYPMFLSIHAKIRILEHDARRQMENKAREAFFDSIVSRKAVNQYLSLKVRRNCLVEDSLRRVSEIVGTGQQDIKKGLRIEFLGEEGVDAGGLRKEWFLLLVREVFDPEHGLFTYDEESRYCYFNPNSFETSDQFFLVGVVLGLAIYNSTILDVNLPPFVFRKLLVSMPTYSGFTNSLPRPHAGYRLEDLAEFRPSLARGLRQLLEFNGDVQETFCRDFVAEVECYGKIVQIPLCPDGNLRPVNNRNRKQFVDLYIHYLLDTAVSRQYEPFKRGFFTVCGGNALSLFRPEEIELLVRGSDEPLDVRSLRAVATYENWGNDLLPEKEPTVSWFWDAFENADIRDQRRLLSFITASDRVPAVGLTSLILKITCNGDDCERFPIARTCFNQLGLFRYRSREKLEAKIWRAVAESEGFGLR